MPLTSARSVPNPTAPEVCLLGGIRWEVLADGRELLTSAGSGSPLESWLREGSATAVKQGAGRVVYRLDLPHRSYFVKQVSERGIVSSIKRWFRAGACRREFEKACETFRRGVPAIVPVAWGERRRSMWSRESFLITTAVPQACSLDDFVAHHLSKKASREQAIVRRRLLDAAARLCAATHDVGLFHNDLHGGNILLRLDTCLASSVELPQLHLVDLPGVEFTGPLDAAQTCRSLAMLCAGFWDRTSEADRRRFWKTYCAARLELPLGDANALAAEVRTAAIVHARRTVARRDKRVWGDNRDFYSLRSATGTAYAVRDLPRSTLTQLLNEPAALWRTNADRPVKLSVGSLVVEADLPDATGRLRHVAVKRLRPKSFWKRWAARWRRGRAFEAWYHGHALLARGIPTARPLAVYEPRGDRHGDGYLITEWLTDAEDVHLYAWELAKRNEAERRCRVRQTAEMLGRLLGRLHDQGFTHRDLKANNLLVREQADGVEAFLIDLDGLRQGARPNTAACCKDLMRLALSAEMHSWLSRGDRLRFLRSYLRRYDPAVACDWKRWWRETAAHVASALAEIRSAGRTVT